LNKINEVQNSEEIKNAIFAQKLIYHEMYICRMVDFAILIAGIILVKALEDNNINQLIIVVINLIFTTLFGLINKLSNNKCKYAATIQEYIDRTLYRFEITDNQIDDMQLEEVKEKIYEAIKTHKKKYQIQINTTGDDPEHGVADWYTNISDDLDIEEAIIKCQRQNTWWDKEQDKVYAIFKIIFTIVLIVTLVFLFKDMWQIIAITVISIALEIYSLYCKYKNYANISREIKTLEDIYAKSKDIQILKEIQRKIFERRKTGYKVPDFLHNLKSAELHQKYKRIFK
jgi:hypothetical protein